jgi:hypothetical protein
VHRWVGERGEDDNETGHRIARKDVPSVKRALPPVGWQRTEVHEEQITTVCACEKTVVMAKQPKREEKRERRH